MIIEIKDIRKYIQLCTLGDTHGVVDFFGERLIEYDFHDTVVFQVGDFGMGCYPKENEDIRLDWLNEILVERNVFVYAIRGNHDEKVYFNNNWVRSNIMLVADYTIIEINVEDRIERIFCFGGAISVDRLKRPGLGKAWWADEVCVFDDVMINEVRNITMVVCHTAPDQVEPYFNNDLVNFCAVKDLTLIDELFKERRSMTYMIDVLKKNNPDTLTKCYYGHFHFQSTGEYNGIEFRLLKINELCLSL